MDDPVDTIYRALASGELDTEGLSARRLSAHLGKTTGALYHHWGSLDGFLLEVSHRGFDALTSELEQAFAERGDLEDVASAFVAFGLDHPGLYELMFERRFDWGALRRAGAFDRTPRGIALWTSLVARLGEAGSPTPGVDARLLYAGLHGLVSLAASGRANVGALDEPDRDVALASARELATRLCPHGGAPSTKENEK